MSLFIFGVEKLFQCLLKSAEVNVAQATANKTRVRLDTNNLTCHQQVVYTYEAPPKYSGRVSTRFGSTVASFCHAWVSSTYRGTRSGNATKFTQAGGSPCNMFSSIPVMLLTGISCPRHGAPIVLVGVMCCCPSSASCSSLRYLKKFSNGCTTSNMKSCQLNTDFSNSWGKIQC